MRGWGARRSAGFTLIETVIAMALIGLVLTKLTMVMEQARRAHQEETVSMALEDQAILLIDRISYAVIGASRQKVTPALSSPFNASVIRFQLSLGVEDGQVVWSDPEEIGLNEESGQVYWGQNIGQFNERSVVWANTVSEMLEDELMNGLDDNDNELADELGLAFVIDGNSVTIRLSLERTSSAGKRIQVTRETTVTCRN
jgi:prepilin-type N-terminal cleavage/methylation domain-containing protein